MYESNNYSEDTFLLYTVRSDVYDKPSPSESNRSKSFILFCFDKKFHFIK